jgi:glycosyltransferase involved in cell wall biosynthesis
VGEARRPKIALVHHWLVSSGGAEKVLYELHRMYPEAPIYTAAYDPKKFPELADADVRVTWLDRVPLAKKKHQFFPILRAMAFSWLDLSAYDLVISSDAAEAKAVKTGPHTLHICYCHTPIRYYWSDFDWYMKHPPFGVFNPLARLVLMASLGRLKAFDYAAAQRVDAFIANSKYVAERIKKYYEREATVIYPPIAIERFTVRQKDEGYYLIVGRQVAYKRLDLAVEAFNELGWPLKVAGTGEEITVQRPRAKANIEFLGRVPDEELSGLYAGAKAFIFPAKEDFGIVPVEAMANGVPVVAYGEGGALEYVTEGKTGVLFKEQTAEALVGALKRLQMLKFDPAVIRARAEQFATPVFERQVRAFVDEQWAAFPGKRD